MEANGSMALIELGSAAIQVSDSEDQEGDGSQALCCPSAEKQTSRLETALDVQGPSFPRFRCGCWVHLRSGQRCKQIGPSANQLRTDKLSWRNLPSGPGGPYAQY